MKSGAITAFVFASLLSASVMAAPHPILEEEHQAGAMVARQGRCTIAFWDYWRNPNNCKLIYPGYPGQGTVSPTSTRTRRPRPTRSTRTTTATTTAPPTILPTLPTILPTLPTILPTLPTILPTVLPTLPITLPTVLPTLPITLPTILPTLPSLPVVGPIVTALPSILDPVLT
ncbi:hypothetical protein A4X06_0g9948, partial [Tilletia controversa]